MKKIHFLLLSVLHRRCRKDCIYIGKVLLVESLNTTSKSDLIVEVLRFFVRKGQLNSTEEDFCHGSEFVKSLLKIWSFLTACGWCVIPES